MALTLENVYKIFAESLAPVGRRRAGEHVVFGAGWRQEAWGHKGISIWSGVLWMADVRERVY